MLQVFLKSREDTRDMEDDAELTQIGRRQFAPLPDPWREKVTAACQAKNANVPMVANEHYTLKGLAFSNLARAGHDPDFPADYD